MCSFWYVNKTYILLQRHGETNDNLNGVIQGQIDTPLNSHGKAQAKVAGPHLRRETGDVLMFFSSDLSRARETARGLMQAYEDAVFTEDPDFREKYLGDFQGKKKGQRGNEATIEKLDALEERLFRGLHNAARRAADRAQEQGLSSVSIVIVSHGASMKVIAERATARGYQDVTGKSLHEKRKPLTNMALTRLSLSVEEDAVQPRSLEAVASTTYLGSALSEIRRDIDTNVDSEV